MGVIRKPKNFKDPTSAECEEDPLSDMIESADDMRIALELSAQMELEQRRRRTRRIKTNQSPKEVDGLSSRLVSHKGHRKQRRLQNDNQLKALHCPEADDLDEVSIYDFVEETVSAFALMIQEKDNLALWEAMLAAEPNYVNDPPRRPRKDRRGDFPAFSPEQCYARLDGDMKRTLKRHRCPTNMICDIEQQLEGFFDSTPDEIFLAKIENSFARLMLHAVCEYMDLKSRSFDLKGLRWTLVKNPHPAFTVPQMPLSQFLESRRTKVR